ncbi:AMP-binding protein [Rhodovulum sp. 12E13]|uniref:AMP-binding protein n=1 Tax=Rhodovulum sp. 12E13 TaxID=2203891 RepID=UPI0018F426E6|nr:AMP-binding protein [Rhodovulum sp. 12E13]
MSIAPKADQDEAAAARLTDVVGALAEHGEAPAVIDFADGGDASLTYARLAASVDRFAAELRADDIGRGARVAILARNGAPWICACLGVVQAGAVPVPVDARLDDDALAHVLSDAAPRVIVTDEGSRERVERLAPGGAGLRPLPPARAEPCDTASPLPEAAAEDTALLFYTSGTTGPPKGVPLSHANVMFELARLRELGIVEPGERLLLPLPLHHVYPFVVGMLTALSYGIAIVFPRALTGPEMQTALREGRATVMLGVPRLFETMLAGIDRRAEEGGLLARGAWRAVDAVSTGARARLGLPLGRVLARPVRRRIAPDLRLLVSGGAALDPGLARRLDGLGWTVATGYGLTETAPMLTILPPGDRHFDSAGRPVKGVDLRIADDAGEDGAGENGAGGIEARGPNVFGGYLGLPEKTAEAFTEDGWYRTEDRGYLDGEGYLHVLGRSKLFAVTEAGENVSLEEVEALHARHPAIAEIGVFMREGRLSAVAVPDRAAIRETGDDPQEAVRAAIREAGRGLPGYKRVQDLAVGGEALDRTQMGKIRRDRLEQRFDALRAGRGEAETGPMPAEQMSADDRTLLDAPAAGAVWARLAERFGDVRLSPDSDLRTDLGIDSMAWVDLTLDIRDAAGVELREEQTARLETVRDLLEAVRDAEDAGCEGPAGAAPSDVTEAPERFLSENERRWLRPLSPAELALAHGAYWVNRGLMRALFRLRVEGLEDVPRDAQVVILPNHASFLDGFLIVAALPFDMLRQTVIAGSADLAFRTRVHRAAMRLARALPIRSDRAAFSSLALPLVKLREGANLVWFPEGRRTPDGRLLKVRPGIGLLLDAHPATAVPVILDGAFEAMPIGRALPRPRRITVRFGQPVRAEDLAEHGEGEQPRARIADAIGRRMAELKRGDA